MHFLFHSGLLIWGVGILLLLPECEDKNTNPANGCTEMGCSDGYSLIIQPTNTRFQEGIYEVSMITESMGIYNCSFRVISGSIAEENCNAIYLVGYPYPDKISIDYPVITGFIFVEVKRNNETIVQTNFNPVYKFIQPNGPGCPPICKVSNNTVFID